MRLPVFATLQALCEVWPSYGVILHRVHFKALEWVFFFADIFFSVFMEEKFSFIAFLEDIRNS